MRARVVGPPVWVALVALSAAVGTAPATPPQYRTDPFLSAAATALVGRPVVTQCPTGGQWRDDPVLERVPRAVGYATGDRSVLGWARGRSLCAWARDGRSPRTQAAAILVFAHEQAHLAGVHSESRAQCAALRGFGRAVEALGGTRALASRLMPLARQTARAVGEANPEYACPRRAR